MTTPELEDLMARHFEGTLDDAGAARLEEILASDPTAFQRFKGLCEVHGLLRAREADAAKKAALPARVLESAAAEEKRRALTDRVMASIGQRRRRAAPAGSPWIPILVAAGLLVAIAAIVVVSTRPVPEPPRTPVAEKPKEPVPLPPAPRPPVAQPLPPPPKAAQPSPEPPKPPSDPPKPEEAIVPGPPTPEPPKPPKIETPTRPDATFRAVVLTHVRGSLRTADSTPAAGARIERGTSLFTTHRAPATFVTDAGFTVTLDRGTSVFLEQEEAGAVRARLASGTAFFEVAKRETPFAVLTRDGEVSVRGTAFQVEQDSRRTAVHVLEGSVKVATTKGDVLVAAGQMSSARRDEKPASPSKADVASRTAWRKQPGLAANPSRPYADHESAGPKKFPGLVLAAPFYEGEAESGRAARATAERMDAGFAMGHFYRDVPNKLWINVDRGMEAPVQPDGTPGATAFTDRARRATADYLAELRAAAGAGPRDPVPMIVQFRNHYEPGLDACEVAWTGWNKAVMAQAKSFYAQLLEKHKPAYRAELRFQEIDRMVQAEADPKIEGYMAPKNARCAVSFFMSPAFGKREEDFDVYSKILAELIEFLYARRR